MIVSNSVGWPGLFSRSCLVSPSRFATLSAQFPPPPPPSQPPHTAYIPNSASSSLGEEMKEHACIETNVEIEPLYLNPPPQTAGRVDKRTTLAWKLPWYVRICRHMEGFRTSRSYATN